MAETRLLPLAGINTVGDDAALMRGGDAPRLYLRDALNVDVTAEGKARLRQSLEQVSATPYANLWQSPLHGDIFATLGADWVKVDPSTWEHRMLATVGEGYAAHEVLNNQVAVAAPAGIFTFDGNGAQRLTLETPAAPFVMTDSGSLPAGTYGAAVAWLRGAQESAPSEIAFTDVPEAGGLSITLPLCLDASVTGARLYLTRHNGGELLLAGDYPLNQPIHLPLLPEPGRAALFRHLSPMPTGQWLKVWRGRLLTARANVLRWSEALTYHLHDERHGFVQMPQRITFVQPVDGGIWVGQVDHVAFLAGAEPGALSLSRKASRAPIPGSATLVPAEVVGSTASSGGAPVALWLAENGYVLGASDGGLSEVHANVLSGITAQRGTAVVLDRRVYAAVT